MADKVSTEVRSRMMAGIRGKNTKPEIAVRKELHSAGFRYKLHDKRIPGKPDLVFPKFKAVIFIHGCFWHGHDCHLFRMPSSNTPFWQDKISGNINRDRAAVEKLTASGWKVATVWECALKGKTRRKAAEVTKELSEWLTEGAEKLEIGGNRND